MLDGTFFAGGHPCVLGQVGEFFGRRALLDQALVYRYRKLLRAQLIPPASHHGSWVDSSHIEVCPRDHETCAVGYFGTHSDQVLNLLRFKSVRARLGVF